MIVSCLVSLLVCSDDGGPTRLVQIGQGMLDMAISDRWELERSTEEGRIYFHREHEALRLHIWGWGENMGQPLRVTDVKSLVGRELNLAYGGVSTRVSLGGNAMIKYTRERVANTMTPFTPSSGFWRDRPVSMI
ncbi:MAG: hypothetical protein GY910_02645 [bacterium]|nr:hypothetical protein [Deltaproteobacteria bacterium]MCP4903852.1 hypothetical protein [bacterium]